MDPAYRKGATYADIEALPEGQNGELFGDELFVSPRPAPAHALAVTELTVQLGQRDGGQTGSARRWRLLFEPELHLNGDVMIPDLAAWRVDRMPALPKKAYFELAPDWICEAVSPGTARLDRIYKLPRYAAAKVAHAWIVDPAARTIDAFRLDRGLWTLIGCFIDDDRARIEPFTDVELDLSRLWPDRVPSVHSPGPDYKT